MVWKLVETYPEINQLNIEFRLELLKCHFAANSQQGRVINWLRVLQISKEILAIDEFNVNACVSLNFGLQIIFKEYHVFYILISGAIFVCVEDIGGCLKGR